MSPSNSAGTTKSTNGNPGSTGFSDADTSSTEVSAISTDPNSVSTGINMGLTQPGAGSTNITTGPTGANTEPTVSEITSTQASTESTAATTVVYPGLTFEEILSIKTSVCIQSVKAGYLYTNASTANEDRRFSYVSNGIVPADTPESRWTLEPGEDGRNNSIYIRNYVTKEYWYPSTFGKETFKIANQQFFVNCTSESDFPPDKNCLNFATNPFTWIPGSKDSDEIWGIIPTSENRVKIVSVYYPDHYEYASDGDITTVVAGANSPDENLLWRFERCDF